MKHELKPCPFCGGAVSRCDESPLYGGSIMHDETECLFKNNLLFHGNINDRWNSRPIEDALQARIAELKAEVANLNDWLTAWKESLNLAQAEIAKLWKHLAEANDDYEHLMAERNLTQAENESLITKIAELKAIAIQWHKYPDEKPIEFGRYAIHRRHNVMPRIDIRYWTGNEWRDRDDTIYDIDIAFWAYLPAPPEDVKK